MKKIFTTLCAAFVMFFACAQEGMDYFLPADISYNRDIPTPEEFFKQQLGEWHLTHDQVLNYMYEIARISDRAIIYEYARSYENKPLVHLVFTSEGNQAYLEELKALHARYSNPDEDIPIEGIPLVVSLTYGVHGNESSGPNASVLTAYHLAAAQGENIDKLLANTIIIVDPCLNPDGFTRHSTWANMHQSDIASGDKNSRQFYEGWPRGRTNHYWFDLNRDYLLLVNPESKGRVEKFHEWKPNVVTDHHESSPNTTFFFQPGVPSRNNPLIPAQNFELTREIATYHARYLDRIGSQYFSEESFDDYYFGKGSTYPDINAGIGILFEASSIRGRVRETSNGLKKLSLGIKNHFTVSLSTLEASMNLHNELLYFQKEFYKSALDLAEESETIAYLFGSETDKVKTQKFVEFLNQHQIEVYNSDKPCSFIVPVKQKQFRLLTSIFEEVTSFRDTAFYDVSTWTFTHAFDIPVTRLTSLKDVQLSDQPVSAEKIRGSVIGEKSSVAYLFRWNEYSTPEALYHLQNEG
ncbi:MAG: zinc carboxypeptidase, partial [Bacteroidetes bacterium]